MERPKPKHLSREYGSQFADGSVVAAYEHRPVYPDAVSALLAGLVPEGARRVLEIGSGTGDLTLQLLPFASEIDAVEPAEAMRRTFVARLGAAASRVNLIAADAETASLAPPYDLVVAGESLHWTEWSVTLPRIADALAPDGRLAIVGRTQEPLACEPAVRALIGRYSTNHDYVAYDLIEELETRGLFRALGRASTGSRSYAQGIPAFIESLHSRNGFSRDRMRPADADALDTALAAVMREAFPDGTVRMQIGADVIWGTPAPVGDQTGA